MKKVKNVIKPDYLSLVTHQISIGLIETDTIFSTATAFLYSLKERIFLITNWHNITGRNPSTNELLSQHAGIPNILVTYFRFKDGGGRGKRQIIKLYKDEDMTQPNWLVHPTYKEKVDVVAIEVERLNDFDYYTINEADFDEDIPPEVADESFVIGYPFDKFRYLGLPIWKKASIATEPTINEDQLPKILIDTATRPGLSGSPVVYQRVGIHKLENGYFTDDSLIGRIRGFLGVYSGRIGKGEIHAQLGIVWKKHVINEIIEGNVIGNIEFQK